MSNNHYNVFGLTVDFLDINTNTSISKEAYIAQANIPPEREIRVFYPPTSQTNIEAIKILAGKVIEDNKQNKKIITPYFSESIRLSFDPPYESLVEVDKLEDIVITGDTRKLSEEEQDSLKEKIKELVIMSNNLYVKGNN